MLSQNALLDLITQAILEDASLETGGTRDFDGGILVEVRLPPETAAPEDYAAALKGLRDLFESQHGEEVRQAREERRQIIDNAREQGVEVTAEHEQRIWDQCIQLREWDTDAELREELTLASRCEADAFAEARRLAKGVTLARDLIVTALNDDSSPMTGEAIPLGEHRFRLEVSEDQAWLGTVAAFVGLHADELKALWPHHEDDVFALRLIPLKGH